MDTFEFVLASKTCPFCNGAKETGRLVCQTCYKAHNLENEVNPYVISILKDVEEELKAQHGN